MSWKLTYGLIKPHLEKFKKSYSCVNIKKPPIGITAETHATVLITEYNRIAVILQKFSSEFPNDLELISFFEKIHFKIINAFRLLNLTYSKNLTCGAQIETDFLGKISIDTNKQIDDQDNRSESSASSSISSSLTSLPKEEKPNLKMALSAHEFLNLASRLIPEFDGKSENLQTFVDAINLTNLQVGAHANLLLALIKTKLKGTVRNLITEEATDIIQTLRNNIKRESTEVLTAKILSTKQNSKSANNFTEEINQLTKALENSYIAEGVPAVLASKYSTQTAIKSLTKNAANEKVKIIMEAGQFTDMNSAIAKFVGVSTDSTSNNTIMYYRRQYNNRGNYNTPNRYNNNRNVNRNNPRNYQNRNAQNRYRNNDNYQQNNNNRRNNNNNNNYYRQNNNNNNRNVRNINAQNQGNGAGPQRHQEGDPQHN